MGGGDLYAIYVLPDHQRRGIGHELFRRVRASLVDEGATAIMTCVFAENPARGFFEALGGTYAGVVSSKVGHTRILYRWNDITVSS